MTLLLHSIITNNYFAHLELFQISTVFRLL